jgi:hypothetical protein
MEHRPLPSPDLTDFPFPLIDTSMLLYDLRHEAARQLRCEWYDEHIFWGGHVRDELSLAFVMGKRRILQQHGPTEKEEWTPVAAENKMDVTHVRLLKRPMDFSIDWRTKRNQVLEEENALGDMQDEAMKNQVSTNDETNRIDESQAPA